MYRCYKCKYHELFIEGDGTNDGCVCWNDKSQKYHLACNEQGTNKINCPFYERGE